MTGATAKAIWECAAESARRAVASLRAPLVEAQGLRGSLAEANAKWRLEGCVETLRAVRMALIERVTREENGVLAEISTEYVALERLVTGEPVKPSVQSSVFSAGPTGFLPARKADGESAVLSRLRHWLKEGATIRATDPAKPVLEFVPDALGVNSGLTIEFPVKPSVQCSVFSGGLPRRVSVTGITTTTP